MGDKNTGFYAKIGKEKHTFISLNKGKKSRLSSQEVVVSTLPSKKKSSGQPAATFCNA